MNPSICAGSIPPYGCATYSTGTPRSGKMSRAMRSSARKPTNAAATTIIKSEIGRRIANDTKLIVPPRPAVAPGRPSAPRRRQRNHGDIWEKCGSDFRPYAQLPRSKDLKDRAELGQRTVLGWPGVCGPRQRGHGSAEIAARVVKLTHAGPRATHWTTAAAAALAGMRRGYCVSYTVC